MIELPADSQKCLQRAFLWGTPAGNREDNMSDRKGRGHARDGIGSEETLAISERSEETSSFEIALIVANNAFTQWVTRCAAAAGLAGLSPLDILILNLINRRLPDKRPADICFAMKVEDS